jgi:hypothetical protein
MFGRMPGINQAQEQNIKELPEEAWFKSTYNVGYFCLVRSLVHCYTGSFFNIISMANCWRFLLYH